jgi:hypothetical protein
MKIGPIVFRALLLSYPLQAIVSSIDLSNILSRLPEPIIGLKITRKLESVSLEASVQQERDTRDRCRDVTRK